MIMYNLTACRKDFPSFEIGRIRRGLQTGEQTVLYQFQRIFPVHFRVFFPIVFLVNNVGDIIINELLIVMVGYFIREYKINGTNFCSVPVSLQGWCI